MVIDKTMKKDRQHAAIFKSLGLPVPSFAHYKVLVMKVFKGNVTAKEDTYSAFFPITIQTSAHQSSCGSNFIRGKTYLFTGRIFSKVYQVNSCDWSEEMHLLTPSMRRGIHGEYQCQKCRVNTCINGYCDNDSKCKWQMNYGEPIDECTNKHRICKVDKVSNECKWNDGLLYEACSNKVIVDMYKP